MFKYQTIVVVFALILLSALIGSCTPEQDEQIRENVRVPGLQEGVQARDRSLETAVESNIMSDIEVRWYAQTYGITVEVSHAVATVHMKVKTQELHDRAIELARNTEGVSDIVDNIAIDASLDSAPFEW